jgi:hypothetical protein
LAQLFSQGFFSVKKIHVWFHLVEPPERWLELNKMEAPTFSLLAFLAGWLASYYWRQDMAASLDRAADRQGVTSVEFE